MGGLQISPQAAASSPSSSKGGLALSEADFATKAQLETVLAEAVTRAVARGALPKLVPFLQFLDLFVVQSFFLPFRSLASTH